VELRIKTRPCNFSVLISVFFLQNVFVTCNHLNHGYTR
jgi:hypothetical protein